MKLSEVIFTDNLPSVDLHGLDRQTARFKVNEFINDQKKMKCEIVTIVHGKGSGIVKNATYEALRKNKYVVDYCSFYLNSGMTIVQINIDKN